MNKKKKTQKVWIVGSFFLSLKFSFHPPYQKIL
jgi:hypothetical protein